MIAWSLAEGIRASGMRVTLYFCAAAVAALTACGGSNNTTLHNPAAPPTTPVTIAFNPVPTSSISLVGSASLTAVVGNDPANMGVDWALLCPGGVGPCGQISTLHTASGKATMYTPPVSITGNSQGVTIEAFASADHNANTVAALTVTGFDSNLKGTYVFSTNGEDANGPYQLAGVVVLDGKGNVSSGEQTYNDPLGFAADHITGGVYNLGPDGRGTLTLNTADQNIGQLGIENFALAFVSSSEVFLQTLDSSNPNLQPSEETSIGRLDLQTSTTAPTGGYAFVVNGVDAIFNSMAMGGVINIDSPNAISGNGSVLDQQDASVGTPVTVTPSGTLTTPDRFGALKINLTAPFGSSPSQMQFTGYIVDSSHITLVETDNLGNQTGFGSTVGVAIGQGAATGTFTNGSAFAGRYVFDITGQDPLAIPLSLAAYGQFTADANGNMNSGYSDEVFSAEDPAGTPISDSFTGTYTLDATGTGRVDSINNFSMSGSGPELIFYLTGNGNPPLVLDADDNPNSLGVGSIGTGYAHPQAAPPYSFNGKYGVRFAQTNQTTVNTGTGSVIVNGGAASLAGTIDTNALFVPEPDFSLAGNFGSIPVSGRFTGTLTDGVSSTTFPTAFYPVNPNLILFIETDYATSGISTFGYFTTRTPVCSTCQ